MNIPLFLSPFQKLGRRHEFGPLPPRRDRRHALQQLHGQPAHRLRRRPPQRQQQDRRHRRRRRRRGRVPAGHLLHPRHRLRLPLRLRHGRRHRLQDHRALLQAEEQQQQ